MLAISLKGMFFFVISPNIYASFSKMVSMLFGGAKDFSDLRFIKNSQDIWVVFSYSFVMSSPLRALSFQWSSRRLSVLSLGLLPLDSRESLNKVFFSMYNPCSILAFRGWLCRA